MPVWARMRKRQPGCERLYLGCRLPYTASGQPARMKLTTRSHRSRRPPPGFGVAAVVFAFLAMAAAAGAGAALGPDDALRVRGHEIVDRRGRPVPLRGVNVGGWLVMEGWMCGRTDSRDRWARETLEDRFGAAKADDLLEAWHDRWFTGDDLDRLRGWGFNVVRVPFSYRTLQGADGQWKRSAQGDIDFARLDWIVREAGRRGVYVVLDLHIWFGQRENYHRISREEPGGDEDRARAAALWREVARHFKGHPAIAGFDVINEPEGSPDNLLHRALYEAVRSQDRDRVVILESVGYRSLAAPAWNNVVWSGHYPTSDQDQAGTVEERVARWAENNGLDRPGVPVFVGELKAPADTEAAARELVAALDRRGWSWAVWTYRAINAGGWAAFNYYDSMTYDLSQDSYPALRDKWTQGLGQGPHADAPRNAYWNTWWIEGFRVRPPPAR